MDKVYVPNFMDIGLEIGPGGWSGFHDILIDTGKHKIVK